MAAEDLTASMYLSVRYFYNHGCRAMCLSLEKAHLNITQLTNNTKVIW
jgi:hypothetical protein